jgi:hypothetical protein
MASDYSPLGSLLNGYLEAVVDLGVPAEQHDHGTTPSTEQLGLVTNDQVVTPSNDDCNDDYTPWQPIRAARRAAGANTVASPAPQSVRGKDSPPLLLTQEQCIWGEWPHSHADWPRL